MMLEKTKIAYIPVKSSISTTGHKLQGKTLEHLVVNSWAYGCSHWVYVVLSRVKTLNGLILNQKLDEDRSYEANRELVRWEETMKKKTELKTFRCRGNIDVKKYLDEEEQYNHSFTTILEDETEVKGNNCLDEVKKGSVIEKM